MTKLAATHPPKPDDYLNLTASDLLEAYGAGNHIPGSGSAAAFSALMAIELLRTVCKLTLQKDTYHLVHKEIAAILAEVEHKHQPTVHALFVEDIRVFDIVSKNRILRDGAVTESDRTKYSKQALTHQKTATTIPIEICKTAFDVLELALVVFDIGFKAARGDTGVAISNLLAAASGSLFIVFLNLKSFRKGQWARRTRNEAEQLASRFVEQQRRSLYKVFELYKEGFPPGTHQMQFEFPRLEKEA